MKAISFRQPWAFAMLHLGKTIENRVGTSTVRHFLAKPFEEFLIHASSGVTPRQKFHDDCEKLRAIVGRDAWEGALIASDGSPVFVKDSHGVWLPGEGLPLGGIEHRISNKALDHQVKAVEKKLRETEHARDMAYEEVIQSRTKLSEADKTAAQLRGEIQRLERDRDHWKSHHDNASHRLSLAECMIEAMHAHYAAKFA